MPTPSLFWLKWKWFDQKYKTAESSIIRRDCFTWPSRVVPAPRYRKGDDRFRFGTKPIHDFLNFNVPVFTTQGTQFIGPFRGNLVKGSIALEYHFPTNIVAKSLDKRYKGPCEFPQFVARKELGQPRERPHLEANPPSIFRVQLVESCQQSIRYHVFPLLQGFGDKVNVVNARLRCILQNKKVKARLATGRIVSSE